MKIFKICLTVAISLLFVPSFGQILQKRLKVGDTIPDLILHNIINYNVSTAKLSDFKDKAIILDFWSKDCSACISSMPKMQKIQEEFKDELVILLVNSRPEETRDKLNTLFTNSTIVKNVKLPMVLGDSQFDWKGPLFPHFAVPYCIWIDKRRVIRATSGGAFVSPKTIKELIEGKSPTVSTREDLLPTSIDTSSLLGSALDMHNGLFRKYLLYYNKINTSKNLSATVSVTSKNLIVDPENPYYTALMKDDFYQLGNLAGKSIKITYPHAEGSRLSAQNAIDLYLIAYNLHNRNFKVIIDGEDCRLFYPPKNSNKQEVDQWRVTNTYIYESVLPIGYMNFNHKEYRDILQKDLANYFGLTGNIELRKLKCLVFFRNGQSLKLPKSKGGPKIKEKTESKMGFIQKNTSAFANLINEVRSEFSGEPNVIVLDETGITDVEAPLDMTIYSKLNDVPSLSKELSKYGIAMKEEMRVLPVLVLRK